MAKHMTYKRFQKKQPKIFAKAQQEIRDFYKSLGVVLVYKYDILELPTEVYIEGQIPQPPPSLKRYVKAYVYESVEVEA